MRLSPLGCAKDTSCSGIFSALFPFNARRQLPLALASASFRFWAIIFSTHNGNNHKRSKTILGLLILVIAILKMLQLSKLLISIYFQLLTVFIMNWFFSYNRKNEMLSFCVALKYANDLIEFSHKAGLYTLEHLNYFVT